MKIITIPNLMTCGNLLCGCLGIMQVFEGNLLMASYLIFIAGVLDFLDGFVARAMNSSSPIGKELDSLADMVTFGALPAFMVLKLFLMSDASFGNDYYKYIPLILAIFSALRLAKFNVDTRQSDSFIGVPTPANALVVASFPLILEYHPDYAHFILNPVNLIAYSLIMSFLLIAELPLLAFKFKSFAWADNQIKYVFLGISVLLLILLKFVAIPLVVLLYVLVSVVNRYR
ncbi:MAG: CDP-diacylglycerol--serine O-phosphatidyltransferase [Spirosomaceae bacterium]|nr:CDP-diacylglycerol--serine O-phosphatidyltransferase [Spirosomataceae bacterium]